MKSTNCLRFAIALLVAVVTSSCGGGSGGGQATSSAPPPAPPPTFNAPPLGNELPGPRPDVGPQSFVNFESGQVRPLALSSDGTRLFATNTPDNRLEIFSIGPTLTHIDSVLVGLEPIAIAEDPDGRVWVVNHLSDSISIVDVTAPEPYVIQTLWVGDEPRDIVFAGSNREKAFITTAHRGQNSPVDPGLSTPGIGRADIWIFDGTAIDDTPGGQALDIVTLFGDRPRPLAVSSDGLSVLAGIFLSGNKTTVLGPSSINKVAPTASADGVPQPESGIIVRFDGQNWLDEQNKNWNGSVPFMLPDLDVFELDARDHSILNQYSGVGTTLFNIAVNPADDTIYVSNTEARNHVRFSGEATRANTTVRGHATDQRVTVIRGGVVAPRILNKHLNFSANDWSQQERDTSLSTPMSMAISSDGQLLYLTAFGSSKIVIYDTSELHDDSFVPSLDNQIELQGGGPSGVVLDETNQRAYVLTRFDNSISTIDLNTNSEIDSVAMFNPEPPEVRAGRPFLYDARLTSGNGNDSCSNCHIFGDTDGLAWDLGEPDGTVSPIPNVFISISEAAMPYQFHPMKGPMTTQSMRGLRGHGPMHWRGDRTGSNRTNGETLEDAAFKEFNDAFDALAALGSRLDDTDMQLFTDFAMRISYPPNPIRSIDNQLQGNEVRGESLFLNGVVRIQTGLLEVCNQCHILDPAAGLFGTKGLSSANGQPGENNFKIPHFRDQYQKVGSFGNGFQTAPDTGPQVRGFGFNHNGATTSNFALADLGMSNDDLLALRAFLYGFPTESPPVTGQSFTISMSNKALASVRLSTLIQRAEITDPVPECDLVANGIVDGIARSWVYDGISLFIPNIATNSPVTRNELEALVVNADDRLTFICAPWGSGRRIGIDRDLDGVLDGDEQ